MPPSRRRSDAERKAAVESLFLVRAVETAADNSGEKEVWHQASKGADLFTVVNLSGYVIRQEFVLHDDYFTWQKGVGLRTGSVNESRGIKDVVKASDEVRMDPYPDDERLGRARTALESYSGDDRYLLHVRSVIKLAGQAEAPDELSRVTKARSVIRPEDQVAANAGKSAATAALWPYLAAGSVCGFVLVAVIWLFIR